MKRLYLKKPVAVAGLTIIILILLGSSIASFIIIWHMNDQANEAVHIEDLYQQAHYLARSEDGVANDYYINPGDKSKDNYNANADELNNIFYTLAQQGDTGDQTLVASLLKAQKLYILRTYQFFYMVDIHDPQAKSFYNNQVDTLATSLNTRLQTELNIDHQESGKRTSQLKMTEQVVVTSLILVFLSSILLFITGYNILSKYQREIVRARQAEWEQMEQLAHNDPLTGLPNHRVTIEHLEREVAICQHRQQSCALMFVDLDHFKRINDQWGHQVGDNILCAAGRRLQSHLRPEDMVGRYGGEEFVVILHQIDLPQAEQLAERLRASLADHPCFIQGEDATSPKELIVTASIGIAVFQHHGTTTAALLEAADSAMYHAKRSGRNRVCVANDLSSTMQDLLGDERETSMEETMTLQALAAAAQTRDNETSAHAHRMVKLAGAIALRLQCSPEECHLIRLAALLHDIGKIGIPDAILHKPGPLTSDEWKVMRQHPVLGQQMLTQVGGIFEELARIVVAHHERWDGQGYPFALTGQEIPLGARILSVVDSYDAMTSLRIYRQPLSEDEARTELLRCAGSQFDPQIVDALLAELDAEKALEISKEAVTTTKV